MTARNDDARGQAGAGTDIKTGDSGDDSNANLLNHAAAAYFARLGRLLDNAAGAIQEAADRIEIRTAEDRWLFESYSGLADELAGTARDIDDMVSR
jgi:hypothetical protein